MRERIIYKNGEHIYHEKDGVVLLDRRDEIYVRTPMVMADIKPYRSIIDGSEITSRSRHREHLRQHGCIEVGNEQPKPPRREGVPGLKEDVIRAFKRGRE